MKSWSRMHLVNNLKKSHIEFEKSKFEETKEHLATSRDEDDPTHQIIKKRWQEDEEYYTQGKKNTENWSLNWKKSSISTIPEYGSSAKKKPKKSKYTKKEISILKKWVNTGSDEYVETEEEKKIRLNVIWKISSKRERNELEENAYKIIQVRKREDR